MDSPIPDDRSQLRREGVIQVSRIDHTCSTRWALDHGFVDADCPMDATWCITYKRDAVMRQREPNPTATSLRLWKKKPLELYYAPWDWMNKDARVILVGITGGAQQAKNALQEAKRCLEAGMKTEEVLRRADAVGSFSGQMRERLVTGLNRIGLPKTLGIQTAGDLFAEKHHRLLGTASAIGFPMFITKELADGSVTKENYNGQQGHPLLADSTLCSFVRAYLGAKVDMAPNAVVLPLGKVATAAVQWLICADLLDAGRCVHGFPHPSPQNGHYTRLLEERESNLKRHLRSALRG